MNANSVKEALAAYRNAEKAAFFPAFFSAKRGGYAEGDKFIGVTVPNQRIVAKNHRALALAEVQKLLNSEFHEHRLTGLLILTYQYPKADDAAKQAIYDFYLANARAGRVDNWDLVDASAHKIVGAHLLHRARADIFALADSNELWQERIAVVATFAFIKADDFDEITALCEKFLTHQHHLIHKATGWMLREAGKRDETVLCAFLDAHAHEMPRTMLRYAIERLPAPNRQAYMNAKKPAR